MARKRNNNTRKERTYQESHIRVQHYFSKGLQEALKDLLGDTIQNMLEAELMSISDMRNTNHPRKKNQTTGTVIHQRH
jgi:cytochrome b involved in lipid metabolism